MKSARVLGLFAYLLCLPALGLAASDQEVTLKADTLNMDVPTDSYRARGSVRMERAGVSLLADSVIYHRLTADAVAEGHILMEKAGDTLKGDRLFLNLNNEKGELLNGELFIKSSNFRVLGKKVEKTGDEEYHVERGSFTTCDGDNPSWHFEARDLEVTLDEFATGRDAVFYVGRMPILYTPYVLFPVKKDRQSGLLLPKLGHSTKKGAYYVQPYYWAATPSQDVTFDLDLQTSRGAGIGADYRYLRKGGSEGNLQVFGIYDTEAERFRGELNQRHLELLTPSVTLASDIHLIADRNYFRDYTESYGEYNRQLLQSSVSFDKRWERFGASAEFRYVQDLVASNNSATLQTLPAANFVAAGSKLGPVFFSMDSGVVNFEREKGVTGQRVNLHPRFTLYEKPAGLFDFSLFGGYQERLYNVYGSGTPGGARSIGNLDAGSTLSLPLERIYDAQLRHLLIPAIEYGYVETKRDDQYHYFDWNDEVLGQSMLKWSVANLVTRKDQQAEGAAEYRDLIYLKLSQGFQFSGDRRDRLTLVDPKHRLTDLMLETKIWPLKNLGIVADGRYNPVDNNLSTADIALELKGQGSTPKLAALVYRYSRDELSYLEGQFSVPVTSQLSASVLGRYSFDKGGFLESRYSLEYKRQCWGIVATYSTRPDNKVYTLNFTLAGIGGLVPLGF